MNNETALNILDGLANGVDPVTGEVLPAVSPYNHPDVIRALFFAVNHLSKTKKPKKTVEQKQQENIEKGLPQNYGLPWEDSDVQVVINAYRSDVSLSEIAHQQCRKPSSIISLLKKHGAITEEMAINLAVALK